MGIGFAPLTQFVIVIQKQHFKNARKFELLISDQIFEYLLLRNVSSEPVLPVLNIELPYTFFKLPKLTPHFLTLLTGSISK